jgi:hypothetical protein
LRAEAGWLCLLLKMASKAAKQARKLHLAFGLAFDQRSEEFIAGAYSLKAETFEASLIT